MKRFLDCNYSDVCHMNKQERLDALEASEGRILISECTLCHDALHPPVSNMEINAAFGADLLLLNMLDVFHPVIDGVDAQGDEVIHRLKNLTGRLVGVNLEPVDLNQELLGETTTLCEGRIASKETALRAKELGIDFILLTGNPGSAVSNQAIIEALHTLRDTVGDDLILMAGKMHAAGSKKEAGEHILTEDDIKAFVDAGADVILIPAPGTVPGITLDFVRKRVEYAHSLGVLTLTSIGTSQEDADLDTIKQIALMCKMSGTDLHHIGDAGMAPIVPESILTYSITIRGKRHTYVRMARSIIR